MGSFRDDIFDQHLAAWQEWCATPWGRIRFAVVAETLDRQVTALQAGGGRRCESSTWAAATGATHDRWPAPDTT